MRDYSIPLRPGFAALAEPSPELIQKMRRGRKPSEVQLRGIRYERYVHRELQAIHGPAYLPNPWIYYYDFDAGNYHYCQPDALLFDIPGGKITICEVKLKHTPMAQQQLLNLYLPCIRHIFGAQLWKFAICEITRFFDYKMSGPFITLTKDITACAPEEYSIFICRPRGAR